MILEYKKCRRCNKVQVRREGTRGWSQWCYSCMVFETAEGNGYKLEEVGSDLCPHCKKEEAMSAHTHQYGIQGQVPHIEAAHAACQVEINHGYA